MSLETLMDGPHLSWRKADSGICVLDILTSAAKAGVLIGTSIGDLLRTGDWGQLPLSLPEDSAERQALSERITAHLNWHCEEPDSGLPCADWRGEAEQLLRDNVKAHEEATGFTVTAVAPGVTWDEDGEVREVLAVSEMTVQSLAAYVARIHGVKLVEITSWTVYDSRDGKSLFWFEIEYVDENSETRYEHTQMYPLNAEQERIHGQWSSSREVTVTPDDIQLLSTAKPEDYPLLRAVFGHVNKRPLSPTWVEYLVKRSRYREALEEARRYLKELTPVEQESFLTLLSEWEDTLEELVNHSKAISSDAVHAPDEN